MKTTSALLAAALRNTVGVGCLCALYTIYVQYGYISISYSLPGKTKLKVGCGMGENVPNQGFLGLEDTVQARVEWTLFQTKTINI